MRAVRLHQATGPDGLELDTIAVPRPRAGEALVRVHAAAITRDELAWPTDRLPAIPSYELSGVVAVVGDDVDAVSVGEAVYALTGFERDGAAAEYVAVPAARLAPKPTGVDHLESAAITLAGLTAWQGLIDHGGLRAGQRVLITGAGGDVGRLAVQLARINGAHVIGTCSGPAARLVSELGAHEVLDGSALGPGGTTPVDLVLDTAGGAALERAVALLRRGGRLVCVAEEPAGLTAGVDARYFVVEPDRSRLVELARLVDAGSLRVDIDAVFLLSDARAAFARSTARGRRGKVVIRVVE
jgi:NADPH:quinone reductase-like Zn-dependent oxidoreductase